MIANAKMKIKLLYILGISIIAIISILSISQYLINNVKIGSENYQEIINSKDLLADILPPPGYILETRLTSFELLHAKTNEQKEELIKKLAQLEKDLSDRNDYWKKNLNNQKLVNEFDLAFKSGIKYFQVLNSKFLPAIKNNETIKATQILEIELDVLYNEHRKCVDTLVTSSTEESKIIEMKSSAELSSGQFFYYTCAITFVVITLLVSLWIIKNITSSIEKVENGLMSFFSFLNRETTKVDLIDIDSKDEFGQMAKVVNINIDKTVAQVKDETDFIAAVSVFIKELKSGDNLAKLTKDTSAPALRELKNLLEDLRYYLEHTIARDVNTLIDVLNKFKNQDYTARFPDAYATVAVSINELGDVISLILAENKSNGLTLDESSNILLKNVDRLNISSNEAAASLEETAAALEEITSNIRNTTENIAKMSNLSSNVTKSATSGEALANKTTIAMDEINTQVNAINDAISVIDQIAFQTNILSLNAAVEAATAGEAGKGFAVVAAEVRNLASRSSEAAREIKNIVENAKNKAGEGKEIAGHMIEGYKELNENIQQTITLISDIEMSSKEQLTGIEQINDAVNQLDQQTQQNAAIASEAHNVAIITDDIAKLVVSNANAKQFKGKDEVKGKEINLNKNGSSYDVKTNQVSYKKSTAKITPSNIESKKIVSNNDSDEWESF